MLITPEIEYSNFESLQNLLENNLKRKGYTEQTVTGHSFCLLLTVP